MASVTAIVVTRGDVDLEPIVASLPSDWELVIWNNGSKRVGVYGSDNDRIEDGVSDVSVYGRYAAIEYATNDLIYAQDDDVIVSDPQAIVNEWIANCVWTFPDGSLTSVRQNGAHVVCNMPPEFRPHYPDSALVGFGACFHHSLPETVFDRWKLAGADNWVDAPTFRRCCDVVFTTLTPRVLVDVPKENREMASDPNRMWKQPGHLGERTTVLNLARKVRDA